MSPGRRRGGRHGTHGGVVPIPGMPRWVGHARLEVHTLDPRALEIRISPRVRVHPVRFAAWWLACQTRHALAELWRSLYERQADDHRTPEETERQGDGAPPEREVHPHGW